jgi:integrase
MLRKTFTDETTGKRVDLTARTPEELAAKIALRKKDISEGKVLISKNMTVDKWFTEFLNSYKASSVEEDTLDDYKSRYNSRVKPYIGHMKIKDVREIHCQNILYEMDGMSKTYIEKVKYTMDQMFKRAMKNKLILSNPAEDLEMPEAEDGTHRAITDVEREYTYIVAQYHRGGLWVLTMLLTGMRPSETAALYGRHLDFKNGVIRVESAVKRKNKKTGKTKTTTSVRDLPMPEELIPAYRALNLGPFDPVFRNASGGKLSKTNMRVMWNSFKREMNIAMGCTVYRNQVIPPYRVADDLVPYCYRHTYCTDLEAAGVSLNEAARLMGHKDIRVTAKIYTHASKESFDRVSAQIKEFQRRKNPLKKSPDVGSDVGVIPLTIEK